METTVQQIPKKKFKTKKEKEEREKKITPSFLNDRNFLR